MVTLIAAAIPASAAKIGLSGGSSDPQALNDPTWQMLTPEKCIPDLPFDPTDYRCALYDGSMFANISSIDFQMKDHLGNLIAFPDSISVDPQSDLPSLSGSGFTFRLSTIVPFSCITCVFFSTNLNGMLDPQQVSIIGVNVPEPATVLLFGTGAAYAAWRRRRRSA
jgi:hypothetical protein